MEGCRKTAWGWWRTSLTSSRLLWFLVPLVVVFVLVFLRTGSEGSKWMLTKKYQPWAWPSVISNTAQTVSSNVIEDPRSLSPPKETGVEADFRPIPAAVVGSGSGEEPLSDNSILNLSASPPLANEKTRNPVVPKEQMLNTTINSSHISPSLKERPALRFSKLEKLEARMQQARAAIRGARNGNQSYDPDYIPNGPMYWNPKSFHRSYLEMENQFKVFVYEEGEPPIFHAGPCKSIYAMEGNFIYYMETSQFRTRDPDIAHIYFLPISVAAIVHFIYDSKAVDRWHPLKQTFKDYVNLIAGKYPYWNRSLGADHFILACHDWGPELSFSVPQLFKNSIRGLCNANTSEGFDPSKDVSFPEIHLPSGSTEGLIGGPSPSQRPILVFFAGGLHGPIRPILLDHWENKDKDVQVHKYLPKGVSYYGMMKKSKYCICPSGYEVASPRMVEALYTGCVPVLIKDHYVAPFSDVLNWKTFSVEIPVKDIADLKKILTDISPTQYIRMQRRGKQIRRHFEVSFPPRRYDVFHMILHSVWLRRLNIRLHGVEDL